MTHDEINKACQKIDRETEVDIDNNALMAIAEHVRQKITASESYLAAALDENLTIEGAYQALCEEAQNRRKGNQSCVYIPPDEGFRIIDKYYGQNQPESEKTPNSQTSGNIPPAGEIKSLLDFI